MREAPPVDTKHIVSCLSMHYGIDLESITFLPIGFDPRSASYQGISHNGREFFIKIRSGPANEAALHAQRGLIEHGVPNIIAPIPTRSASLWCNLSGHPGYTIMVYPFIEGGNAMFTGLTASQWRTFGATLNLVHGCPIDGQARRALRSETFSLPSAALLRHMLTLPNSSMVESQAASAFAPFWKDHIGHIEQLLDRAESLGRCLQTRQWEPVLCHSDIHTANILVENDGPIWLVDWDDPILAPRERDLLFIIGSRIAREVTPEEEDLFFEGYGPTEIVPEALVYYRYERIIEDLGEFAQSVFLTPDISEDARQERAKRAMGFFTPDGDIARAETVGRSRWPG